MNTKHAQYMLTVLQEGSITNAAKKLYVSQPSLSQMIKLVENNLGAPIFNRNTDPITLTFAGEKYIEAAKQILTINQNLAREIQEINEEEHGTIRFGIPKRMVPCSSSLISWISRAKFWLMVKICLAASIYFSPANVRVMGSVLRLKIGAPRLFSTSLIIWLREGCETYSFFAALVILPSCRTVSIYCACFVFI